MQRGFKTYMSVRAAVIDVALCAAILAFSCWGGAFPALGAATVVLYMMPLYLMVSAPVAGLLPAGICLMAALLSLLLTGGVRLFLFGALYLLPMAAVYAACLLQNRRFWLTCAMTGGALALSLLAVYLILQAMTGGDLYGAAARAVTDWLNGLPVRDGLLHILTTYGLLYLPPAMQEGAVVVVDGYYAFTPEAVNELLLQVRSYVYSLLQALVPSLLVTGSGLNTLLGVSLGVYYGARCEQRRAYKRDEEAVPTPDLAMPPLRLWHIPRPWGLRIGVLGLGYFLMRYAANNALYMLGALMWQVFYLCFAVQGLAATNFAQHRRGSSRGWRVAVVVMAFLLRFVQIAMVIMGVIDQMSNARGLRPPLQPRDEEE